MRDEEVRVGAEAAGEHIKTNDLEFRVEGVVWKNGLEWKDTERGVGEKMKTKMKAEMDPNTVKLK